VLRDFGSAEKYCFGDNELRPSVGAIVVGTGIIPLDVFGRMVGSISGQPSCSLASVSLYHAERVTVGLPGSSFINSDFTPHSGLESG
jgi:hypothetical protein